MDKATLATINYMSLRIEKYIDEAYECLERLSRDSFIREETNLSIINLQKAHLINECMREMVSNQLKEQLND